MKRLVCKRCGHSHNCPNTRTNKERASLGGHARAKIVKKAAKWKGSCE